MCGRCLSRDLERRRIEEVCRYLVARQGERGSIRTAHEVFQSTLARLLAQARLMSDCLCGSSLCARLGTTQNVSKGSTCFSLGRAFLSGGKCDSGLGSYARSRRRQVDTLLASPYYSQILRCVYNSPGCIRIQLRRVEATAIMPRFSGLLPVAVHSARHLSLLLEELHELSPLRRGFKLLKLLSLQRQVFQQGLEIFFLGFLASLGEPGNAPLNDSNRLLAVLHCALDVIAVLIRQTKIEVNIAESSVVRNPHAGAHLDAFEQVLHAHFPVLTLHAQLSKSREHIRQGQGAATALVALVNHTRDVEKVPRLLQVALLFRFTLRTLCLRWRRGSAL
mmetsp:Transcript_8309/g.30659  ORF Transcript_8309/g.30659 Transcript_8309/m.30659 type:complete len:335 (-) Transcript_8309:448-1452(-)